MIVQYYLKLENIPKKEKVHVNMWTLLFLILTLVPTSLYEKTNGFCIFFMIMCR